MFPGKSFEQASGYTPPKTNGEFQPEKNIHPFGPREQTIDPKHGLVTVIFLGGGTWSSNTWILLLASISVLFFPEKNGHFVRKAMARWLPKVGFKDGWMAIRSSAKKGPFKGKKTNRRFHHNHGSVEYGSISNVSFISFRVIFRFHDCRLAFFDSF